MSTKRSNLFLFSIISLFCMIAIVFYIYKTNKIVEELLSKANPGEIFGKDGLFQQLKKKIVERVFIMVPKNWTVKNVK